MGRADSLARAALLTRPAVAYIHRFPGRDGWHDYELGYDQLARAATWVGEQLTRQGLQRGDRALLTFAGFEGPWFRPLADSLVQLGVVYGTAEAAGWDHRRTRFLNAELAPKAVIGLSLETVEALGEQAALGELARTATVVLARPDAVLRLRAAGVDAGTVALVGPTMGIECRQRAGVHVDGAAWRLEEVDGRPVISGTPEGIPLPAVMLPLDGRVVTQPCTCGSTDPRLVLGVPG